MFRLLEHEYRRRDVEVLGLRGAGAYLVLLERSQYALI